MRLLCDEMLRGIGRWLRAAGYDTLLARSGTTDADLLAFAQAEGRILLTCDRRLGALAGEVPPVVVLGSEAPDAAAGELRLRLGGIGRGRGECRGRDRATSTSLASTCARITLPPGRRAAQSAARASRSYHRDGEGSFRERHRPPR